MITAIFMVFFLETNSVQFISDQTIFKTVEDCEAYSRNAIAEQQAKVTVGQSDPHKAIFKCVNWGSDV